LISDLYRKKVHVSFDDQATDKKYFLVPLKLKNNKDIKAGHHGTLEYELDSKLLQNVEKIATRGYKNCQPNILDWLTGKGYPRETDKTSLPEEMLEEKYNLLAKWMLVKEDKPNSCYHFARLLENLKKMPAEEFALAIRGKPDDLNCNFAFDLLFTA
jgi:hypothetical protein